MPYSNKLTQRAAQRAWAQKDKLINPDRPRVVRHKIRERNLTFLRALKEDKPCMDCGVSYPYFVMEYDHRPGTDKKGHVSQLVNSAHSIEVIQAELAKCDLVCANCHRVRTFTRKMESEPVRGGDRLLNGSHPLGV